MTARGLWLCAFICFSLLLHRSRGVGVDFACKRGAVNYPALGSTRTLGTLTVSAAGGKRECVLRCLNAAKCKGADFHCDSNQCVLYAGPVHPVRPVTPSADVEFCALAEYAVAARRRPGLRGLLAIFPKEGPPAMAVKSLHKPQWEAELDDAVVAPLANSIAVASELPVLGDKALLITGRIGSDVYVIDMDTGQVTLDAPAVPIGGDMTRRYAGIAALGDRAVVCGETQLDTCFVYKPGEGVVAGAAGDRHFTGAPGVPMYDMAATVFRGKATFLGGSEYGCCAASAYYASLESAPR